MSKLANIIIVLGNVNDSNGALSATAESRVRAAAELYKKFPREESKFVFTGGANIQTNCTQKPHAHYMADYLVTLDIPRSAIIPDHADSSNTLEDAQLAKPIIEKYADGDTRLYIVTSEFHIARARITFKHVFGDDYTIITHAAPNATDRETALNNKKTEREKIPTYYPNVRWADLSQREMATLGSQIGIWRL